MYLMFDFFDINMFDHPSFLNMKNQIYNKAYYN
jgi:hypothetical protein